MTSSPDFMKLWAAQGVSVFGTAITQLALPTAAILALHATPFEVGALAAAQRLPFVFLTLPAGAWLDRVHRRPVMIACDLGRAAVLATIPVAAALHLLALWQLFVAALLVGSLTVFFDVGYLAYLPALVKRADLLAANQRLQMTYSLAGLVGPGLAGVLIQLAGAARAITANSVTFLFSALMLLWVRAEPPTEARAPTRLRDEIVEGLRWVFDHALLRSELIGITLGGFGYQFALPVALVFLYEVLRLSPALTGSAFVVEGLATLIGLSLAPRIVRRLRLGRTMWMSQVGIGLGWLLFPASILGAPLAVLTVSLLIIGFTDSVQDVNQVTLRQTLTPPRLQARMNAVFRLFYWGSWPVASFLGGAFASWAGPIPAILAGGAMGVAAAAFIAFSPLGRLAERSTSEVAMAVENGGSPSSSWL